MTDRRSFLRLLGLSPIAAKVAADQAAADLSGVTANGLSFEPPEFGASWMGHSGEKLITDEIESHRGRSKLIRLACKVPQLYSELESELYRSHKHIGSIDPDLASMKSFSLAAKITFQRQRNVEHMRGGLCSEYNGSYEREEHLVKTVARKAREWMWIGGSDAQKKASTDR